MDKGKLYFSSGDDITDWTEIRRKEAIEEAQQMQVRNRLKNQNFGLQAVSLLQLYDLFLPLLK